MQQDYLKSINAHVITDKNNNIREILHRDMPFKVAQPTIQLAAEFYLQKHLSLLKIKPDQLKQLTAPPELKPVDKDVEYRMLDEKTFFSMTTAAYQQTLYGLPVWGKGITLNIKLNPNRVMSLSKNADSDISAKKPTASALKKFNHITTKELIAILTDASGKKDFINSKTLRVNGQRFVVYQFVRGEAREIDLGKEIDTEILTTKKATKMSKSDNVLAHAHPTLPVSIGGKTIKEGAYYVSSEIHFTMAYEPWGTLNWRMIVDIESGNILYLKALVDNVDGLVFSADPFTQGVATATPASNNATLNPLRSNVTLPGLDSPVDGVQSLSGEFVAITDHETPDIDPPTESTGNDFDYNSRTDHFAAVNCYYHSDAFFRLIEDMGFDLSTYFDGSTFPITIDHRGRFGTLDGIEINASCGGNAMGNGIGLPDFELADLSDTDDPLGIATDKRIVMHEFGGHGILWDHVNSANFGFAHSAGDSFAAVLSDPGSLAADRFMTFPWLLASRRHDRDVTANWGWGGSRDTGGYNSEQILATTHFRLYRSLGGDSSRLTKQQFAARNVAYLILRAVSSLTPVSNPANATGYANALLAADLDDWTSEGQAGGAYGKVIRWAFEKQGLYQPAGAPTPVTSEGAPPAVDVYIDDGRQGEYEYLGNHWSCPNIWNRLTDDGDTTHETPIVDQVNYAYVKVKNRGTQTATNVVVKGFHCQPGTGLTWPNDWQAMVTAEIAAAEIAPNDSEEIIVGPFEWIPSQIDHECMLMIASATSDASNIDNFTAGDTIPEWRLVPHDNNIGQRNVAPVPGGGGLRALVQAFSPRRFLVRNPNRTTTGFELEYKLPEMLVKKGWQLIFDNPGGSQFTLAPGATREIFLRIKAGSDFSANEINMADSNINVLTYADDMLMGGMTYAIDPNMKTVPRQTSDSCKEPTNCEDQGQALLDCFNFSNEKVKSVKVKKVTVEIELKDDDC
ncbi:MAG: hypothetical protein OQK98_11515 [Gammaproteobacteria bacterium]|nr:hypothetical protein [Gammaproteobacteria bacterium]